MKKNFLEGTITALVTPFTNKGTIDYSAFEKLIDFQIKSKVNSILIAGTTGEGATMTTKEKQEIINHAVKYINGRVGVIASTGTNKTSESLELTAFAKEVGVNAALIITPYYNKPTQGGMFEHFKLIAEKVDLPQIIYNVPGRTGVNILPETQIALANACKNIVAVKEASGHLGQMMEIIKYAPDGFTVLSGDDALTIPAIALGAKGCISVISNYAPAEFAKMIDLALKNKFKEANEIHYKLLDLMNLNFIESNPIPVKYILSVMGFMKDIYRLPLVPMHADNKKKLKAALKIAGIS
jgi:4-hydroxy-tetrahydrodipicolinate synthase